MPITLNFEALKKHVTGQTLILTPNSRTQKAINAGLVSELAEGEVIYSPAIKSFSQWQNELWQTLSFSEPLPAIVGNLELKAWLKEQIASDENWQLTNELGVAEKILDGYRVLTEWDLGLADLSELDTVENQYFVKWLSALEAFLDASQLIPQFAQCRYLCRELKRVNSPLQALLPTHILLVSFNQFTPDENALLQRLRELGVQIDHYYPERQVIESCRVAFNDFNSELTFAAEMSAKLADTATEKTIGVVVYQLVNQLDKVHQIFSERFQPQESLPWQPLEKIKYNVSAGQTLQDFPMLSLALQLLQLNSRGFDLATLQLLKNSPFLDWGTYSNDIRSYLHAQSLFGYPHYSLEGLLNALEKAPDVDRLSLLKLRLQSLQNRPYAARPMNAWVDVWREELQQWGWLQNYSMNAYELKLQAEFYQALNQCLTLSRIYSVCSQQQAREYLLQVLRQTPFQLPSDRTNVHVLGILEATGLEFDDLILVGFNRDNWPGKARLNPFLPVAFQQQHQMPGSSAEREFEYTRNLTQGLLQATERLWVTQSRVDGGEGGESPLFTHLPLVDVATLLKPEDRAPIKPDYQWLTDEQIELPLGDIRGGAYLLSQYASCPFKAMSQFQFNIRPNQQIQQGIEAKTKGAWLHRALELLWQHLKMQQALLDLSETQQAALVAEMLTQAQAEFAGPLAATAKPEIVQLEFEKLQRQISEWLTLERARKPFSVATEVAKNLTLGPLTFQFRIDRLDTDEDGRLEIIDYKTGATDVKKWLGARPDEAQMPAYVLACDEAAIASLSYAKIKTGEICRSGVWFDAEDAAACRFVDIDLLEEKDRTRYLLANGGLFDPQRPLAAQWRESLEGLAENIANGVMPASPKHPVDSCRYCDFASFCRIKEIQAEHFSEQPISAQRQSSSTSDEQGAQG